MHHPGLSPRWPSPAPGCRAQWPQGGLGWGAGGAAGTYRPVYVLPDEEVKHGQRDVGQHLPQLPGQQHPQDAVLCVQVDPAPADRHVRGIIADLLQSDSCHGDGQRDPPAEEQGTKGTLRGQAPPPAKPAGAKPADAPSADRSVLSKPCTSQQRGGQESSNPPPRPRSAQALPGPPECHGARVIGHRDVPASCLDRHHPHLPRRPGSDSELLGTLQTGTRTLRCGEGSSFLPPRGLHGSTQTTAHVPMARPHTPSTARPPLVPCTHGQLGLPEQRVPGPRAPAAVSRRGNKGFGWTHVYGPEASLLQEKGVSLEKGAP